MALPDRTLCWVEGPPWDRHCEPADDIYTEALELVVSLADEMADHSLIANVAEEALRAFRA